MEVDPARLRIERYPAAVLKRRADQIEPSAALAPVVDRMVALMNSAEGIGLAAPQVGLSWRLFVAHVPHDDDAPRADPPESNDGPEVYINPVIEATHGVPSLFAEGCLSLPGVTGEVLRPPVIDLSWSDLAGVRHRRRAGGLLARCWQHEIDHLDGVLILDRMIEPARIRNRLAIRALDRQGGAR